MFLAGMDPGKLEGGGSPNQENEKQICCKCNESIELTVSEGKKGGSQGQDLMSVGRGETYFVWRREGVKVRTSCLWEGEKHISCGDERESGS